MSNRLITMSEVMEQRSIERQDRSFSFNIEDFEKRDDATGVLSGTAAVFNTFTDIMWFEESIKKGAFEETIKNDDQMALINHDSNFPIASTRNKTLELWEEKDGLKCKIVLNMNVSYSRDLYENVRNKLIDKMSFGFFILREEWITEEDSPTKKAQSIILKARLIEVSPVPFPAYKDTNIELDRSNKDMKSYRDFNLSEQFKLSRIRF